MLRPGCVGTGERVSMEFQTGRVDPGGPVVILSSGSEGSQVQSQPVLMDFFRA